jgi:hypothetical protein
VPVLACTGVIIYEITCAHLNASNRCVEHRYCRTCCHVHHQRKGDRVTLDKGVPYTTHAIVRMTRLDRKQWLGLIRCEGLAAVVWKAQAAVLEAGLTKLD